VDIGVSDELWDRIHGQENLLCGPCITTSLEAISDFDYYDLQHGSINEARATQPATAHPLTPDEADLVIGAIPLQALPVTAPSALIRDLYILRNAWYAKLNANQSVVVRDFCNDVEKLIRATPSPTDTAERARRVIDDFNSYLARDFQATLSADGEARLADIIVGEFK
jgi:hypothetical protein